MLCSLKGKKNCSRPFPKRKYKWRPPSPKLDVLGLSSSFISPTPLWVTWLWAPFPKFLCDIERSQSLAQYPLPPFVSSVDTAVHPSNTWLVSNYRFWGWNQGLFGQTPLWSLTQTQLSPTVFRTWQWSIFVLLGLLLYLHFFRNSLFTYICVYSMFHGK